MVISLERGRGAFETSLLIFLRGPAVFSWSSVQDLESKRKKKKTPLMMTYHLFSSSESNGGALPFFVHEHGLKLLHNPYVTRLLQTAPDRYLLVSFHSFKSTRSHCSQKTTTKYIPDNITRNRFTPLCEPHRHPMPQFVRSCKFVSELGKTNLRTKVHLRLRSALTIHQVQG